VNPLAPLVLRRFATWATDFPAVEIPEKVRELALARFVDTMGVVIAGAATRVSRAARSVGEACGAPGSSTVFGAARRFSAPAAAFMNGTAAHALDFDDNCYAGVVHGSAVIAPAALAVAQEVDASGSELLTAFLLGSECEYALGAATGNVLYDRGWWTTGVLGPVGATVAAGRLLNLPSEQMTRALGLAVAGAGGMKACFGTDAKPLMAGRASEAGVVCALLARNGAVGPANAIESPNGFVKLFNSGEFHDTALDALGHEWFMESPGVDIKRIPVCLSSHAAVDALMELVRINKVTEADIESIICDVQPIVCANLIYPDPATPQEAQFSMQYAIAASLRYGTVTLAHLDAELIARRELASLMLQVEMHSSPMWDDTKLRTTAPEGAHVTLVLRDGSRHTMFKGNPRGSSADPLTPQELDAKFQACVAPSAGEATARQIYQRLHDLHRTHSVRNLFVAAP
jgi:2-methylcitrate dehydratase PrpD